ncbi:hypothetical protein VMCG_04029 [Cytospora schulzeri]|uniref:Uncharacterized protein n=1 Tax=Cytospora schulzeri TaxID=448051 RepID=A0A423WTE7_9PEZI|nr:hypothetical protein VMCG_04029 [Valsa malicola]
MPAQSKRKLTAAKANSAKKPRKFAKTRRARRNEQEYFDFMGLPTELRILIYEEVLANYEGEQGAIRIYFKKNGRRPFFQKFAVSKNAAAFFGLLSVSKEVNLEAADIYYKQWFAFENPRVLQTFLIRAPAQVVCKIRRISLNYWQHVPDLDGVRTPTFALLRGAQNLEEFQFPGDILVVGIIHRVALLRGEPGETPACTIGRSLAAVLYRYCYPLLVPWMERSDSKALGEAAKAIAEMVKMPDLAFQTAAGNILMEGLDHDSGDTKEVRCLKEWLKQERLAEARETMLTTLVKLHRDPTFRASQFRGFGGLQSW